LAGPKYQYNVINKGEIKLHVIVVGSGYVGMVASCCLANSGHSVVAVECDIQKLNKIEQGELPIYEKGLDTIFKKAINSGKLRMKKDLTNNLPGVEIVIIAVGTPSLDNGMVDLSQVHAVAEQIAKYADHPITVLMKSTVPPGSGDNIIERFFSKAKVPISYIANPEFLREGRAVWDWYNPDRIIIGGANEQSVELVKELYADIKGERLIMSVVSAEMVKYASNAFLATKISFINEIANLCDRVGANIDRVSEAVGMDKRIGPEFLKAGIGYGGSCFPKDTKGLDCLSSFFDYHFSLLKAVIEVNFRQKVLAIFKLRERLGSFNGKKIAVLGMAFKPETDDIRESPAMFIIEQLLAEGAIVQAYDPMAMDMVQDHVKHEQFHLMSDSYKACAECHAIVLATEWNEFRILDWEKILKKMNSSYVVLDGRNILDKSYLITLGYQYIGFGR
jgi:UDPglucose 6-dehydrogenase